MSEEKRKRGRPKKESAEFKNPDCEPATKGYVKCIARKLTAHKHKQDNCGVGYFACAVFGATSWLFVMVVGTEPAAAWAIGVGTLISITCFAETAESCRCQTQTSNIDGSDGMEYVYPDYIKKYVMPVCEKKKECE